MRLPHMHMPCTSYMHMAHMLSSRNSRDTRTIHPSMRTVVCLDALLTAWRYSDMCSHASCMRYARNACTPSHTEIHAHKNVGLNPKTKADAILKKTSCITPEEANQLSPDVSGIHVCPEVMLQDIENSLFHGGVASIIIHLAPSSGRTYAPRTSQHHQRGK